MPYEIYLAPEAVGDLRRLPAHVRAEVTAAIEKHLRHSPTATSKSRIKKLKRVDRPQYRLRVAEVRVFYDVDEGVVEVVAIVAKSQAAGWLERAGGYHEAGPIARSQERSVQVAPTSGE